MNTTTQQPTTTSADGELVQLNPAEARIEDNIRTVADLNPEFVASIRRHGVLLPVIGYRDTDGTVTVRDGQLRVLAAREVGRETIPVFVTDRDTTDARRVTEQLVANEHRTALTDTQRIAAYRQLELAGLSVSKIAAETGTHRTTVKTALAVAGSDAATHAVGDRQLTLDAALVYAEFDGDLDAITELNTVDDPDDLPFVAERIRQDRADVAKRTELVTEYTGKGITVIDDQEYTRLHMLTDRDDEDTVDRPPVDPDRHETCPGHAVVIQVWRGGQDVHVTPVCTTPDAHQPRWPHTASRTIQTGPMTDEQKTERKELIANNKAWDAAEVVRRDWITTLLTRRTLPKEAPVFVAHTLAGHRQLVADDHQDHAHQLLGIGRGVGYGFNLLDTFLTENPTKAVHVALAVAISAYENASNRNWWRYPGHDAHDYLGQLEEWGYHLSPIEHTAKGESTATESDSDESEPPTEEAK
jgi:ParB family transcriptional regulator, chromosome partitioning protein